MKHTKLTLLVLMIVLITSLILTMSTAVFASDEQTEGGIATGEETVDNSKGTKAISAAAVVGVVAAVGALAMGLVVSKASESIARQPEAGDKIRAGMMLGLVFIETAIIYALIIAILIVFVL